VHRLSNISYLFLNYVQKLIFYLLLYFFCFVFQSSFSKNKYTFSVYITAQRQIEDSNLPDDEYDADSTLMDSEDTVATVGNRRKVN